MAGERYKIPVDLQPRALAMHLAGKPMREIYLACYPNGDCPVSIAYFTRALYEFQAATESQVRHLADRAGVPTAEQVASADDRQVIELALMPGVQEMPLPAGDAAALEALDNARGACIVELAKLVNEPIPDLVTYEDEGGKKKASVSKPWDPRSVRASAVATVANAITANVTARAGFARLRLERTVQLHNLRLAKKTEEENDKTEAKRDDSAVNAPEKKKTSSGFEIDMSGKN